MVVSNGIWECLIAHDIVDMHVLQTHKLVDEEKTVSRLGGKATSIYIWHFPCYFFLRLILPQQYIEEYGYRLWWYVCVILFISIVGCFSNKYLEPWLNKKTEEVVKAIHYSPADK